MALLAGGAAAGASIYGALTGGSPASNVQVPQQFQLPGLGQASSGALSGIQNLPGQNLGQWSTPLAQQTGQNLYNNPYAGGYQQGAGVAGQLGQQGAINAYEAGGALEQAGVGQIPYAQQLEQMGFDPQNALYNRTQQQVQDQTLSNLSNAGLATSPYGQGVLGNTLGNFNIDWQNQQLQRGIQGTQGAQGVLQGAGNTINQGAGLQAGAAGQYLGGLQMPYGAFSQIGQGQFAALTGAQGVASGAQGLAQQPIQDYLAYLGQGTSQQQANNQTANVALNQANSVFSQQQQQLKNLNAGLYGAGQFAGGLPGQTGYNPTLGASSVAY